MTIDTLEFAEALAQAGVDRKQAEAQARAMRDHVLPKLATKADLVELRGNLTWRVLGIVLAVVGLANGLLFAALQAQ